VVMLRWSRPGVFLAIVLSAVQQFADGDLAPWDDAHPAPCSSHMAT